MVKIYNITSNNTTLRINGGGDLINLYNQHIFLE